MSITGGQTFSEWTFAADPIYVSDLERCQPESALSQRARHGSWRVLPYEADVVAGTMLIARSENAAPEVAYPLQKDGWHAISVGVFAGYHERNGVLVRLSDNPVFTILRARPHQTTPWYRQYHGEQIWEIPWKVADLTGQQIYLKQHAWWHGMGDRRGSFDSAEAMVAYIKLVPLSQAEVAAHQADLRRTDTRRLFTHNDAGVIGEGSTTPDDVRRYLELYRDTDFSRIYWCAGSGDRLNYLSKIGLSPPFWFDEEDFAPRSERASNATWLAFREQGIDPFRVVLDHAHAIGLEFHATYRVSGFRHPPPHDRVQRTSFYLDHPELRGTSRGGQPSPRISYAFSETRSYVISLLREMAEFPVDGISLQFNRRLPVIEYEPPVVEAFKAEHGEDPFSLDERNPRWLAYRATFMTEFMRELRAAMDAVVEEQGRTQRIEISTVVTNSEEENLYYGLDLRAWVEQGLVDTLIPYSSHPNFNSNEPSWTDVRDAEFFIALTQGTTTKLALNLMPRQMSGAEYRRRAAALYAAGVEHLFFWDGALERAQSTGASHVVRRLGHREEIQAWIEAGEPSPAAPTTRLRTLGGWDFSYVSPG